MTSPTFPAPDPDAASAPTQAAQVFLADDIYVSHGVNQGDGVMGPDEVVPNDVYTLRQGTRAKRLVTSAPARRTQVVDGASQVGKPGDRVGILARYTLMAPDGDRVELLLLGLGGLKVVLPMTPMAARLGYVLVAVDPSPRNLQLADLLSLSFSRGTMITLGDGTQCPIEALRVGDMVLTRDHGRQPVRWIGHARLRSTGAFAPVMITAGTLGNSGDLILGQHHRVFLYQRDRLPGVPTSELLVQARFLVDDERVYIREDGWTDYYSLVFEAHEIVYAEGVPVESLWVTEAIVNGLPPEMAEEVRRRFPGLSQSQHFGTEAGRQALGRISPSALFRMPRRDID